MAAFIKSIEKVSTTFDTTAGATSNDISLSKSQDETQCVPFYTTRTTAAGSDFRENDWFGCEMVDVTGTPTVRVHRDATATVSQKHVDIFVIEFGSNVTVQQGSVSLTGTTGSDTISAITEANSFCVFSQVGSGSSDDFNDTMIQARFGSTTSVNFDRRAAGPPDWTVYYYVVESDGTDFLTEYDTFSPTNSQTGPTNRTLSNTLTIANSFLIPSYETSESSDDLIDAICNFAITGTTQLTWYRDHGGTPAATMTTGVWVVRASSSELNSQRFALTIAASTTNDQAITEIDQTKAIIIPSQHAGQGTWSIDNTASGSNIEDRQNTLVFQADTTVRAQQQNAEASGGTGEMRFEVVEFELEAAGVTHDLGASVEANATTESNIQGIKQPAADVEANATTQANAQIIHQIKSDIEANATVAADVQVIHQIQSDIEANATVEGDLEIAVSNVDLAGDLEANATITGSLEVTSPTVEEVTGGGWLPQEELKKLRKIKKDIGKEERLKKDREEKELQLELQAIFKRIHGIEEIPTEVEPVVESTPSPARQLDTQPQISHIDFRELALQAETADTPRDLVELIQRQKDDDDALALLLMAA